MLDMKHVWVGDKTAKFLMRPGTILLFTLLLIVLIIILVFSI